PLAGSRTIRTSTSPVGASSGSVILVVAYLGTRLNRLHRSCSSVGANRLPLTFGDALGLQVLREPVEDEAEAVAAMAGLAGAAHLVVLVGEAHEQHLAPQLLQHDEQLLRLLDRAAQVVLGVEDEERCADVRRVGERRVV